MKGTRRTLILLLLGGLLLTCFGGCGRDAGKDTPKETADSEGGTENTVDTELEDPTRDWEPIETKYGRLRYPDDFFEFLETEQAEDGEALKVLFRAAIRDVKLYLFELGIGGGEGSPVGKSTGPDGVTRDLYLRMIELGDMSQLTDGEKDRVYAMQEALNFVLDHSK